MEAVGTDHGVFEIPAVDASCRRAHVAYDLARIIAVARNGLIVDQ
jgi:hypothetical protein